MRLLYRAVTKDGQQVKGSIEAKDVYEAGTYLRSKGYLPVNLAEKKEGELAKLLPTSHITSSDILFFTKQLSSMLASGLTLMQGLTILRQQIEKPQMATVVAGVVRSIEEGSSFSTGIARYPKVFTPIYISLVKASEGSGLLDKILIRLADNLENAEKLKGTIKGALMYPIIVVTGMLIVLVIMMLFVIPQLTIIYTNFGIELPLPTRILVGFSNFIRDFWFIVGALILLGMYLIKRWSKTEQGALTIDKVKLKVPVFGKLFNQMILTEFSRTLGLLIGSGTLVMDALRQTADVTGNSLYKRDVLEIAKKIEKGVSIGDAMSFSNLFPPMLIQMVHIGEQTGKLDESFGKTAEYFEREVNQTVKGLTTAMEPIIMIALGIGVAFLVYSVVTPMYSLLSNIQ